MKQLLMLRHAAPVVRRSLPDGYAYTPFLGTQAEIDDWLTICAAGLLPDTDPHWFADSIRNYPDLDPARDLFFVTDANGVRVATSAAVRHANGEGYIHMVGSLPSCRGKGIGHAMLSRALEELQTRGCAVITLTTDDHRLAMVGGLTRLLAEKLLLLEQGSTEETHPDKHRQANSDDGKVSEPETLPVAEADTPSRPNEEKEGKNA